MDKLPRYSPVTIKRLLRSFNLIRRYGTARKIDNLVRAELSYRRREVEVRHLPYLFRVDPTTRCTLACPYCWRMQKPPLPTADLSLANFAASFAPFADMCLLVGFQMFGEPTLNPALPSMIEHAHRAGAATYVSTNLQMPQHETIDRLLACGLDLLTVAVDGADEATYRRMKPGGDFALLKDNLDYLFNRRRQTKADTHIGIQVLVTAFNEPELPAIGALARQLGADYFDMKPTALLSDSAWLPRDKRYRFDTYRKSNVACAFPWTNLTLLADGNFFPCCAHPGQFQLGDLGDHSAADIFNSPPLQDIRRQIKTGRLTGLCAGCELNNAPRF